MISATRALASRYSSSLMGKMTFTGSSVETEVSTVLLDVPTRSPTWALATAAMPSTGESTWQNCRLSWAWPTAASSARTFESLDWLSWVLLMNSFSEMTFFLKSSRLRSASAWEAS